MMRQPSVYIVMNSGVPDSASAVAFEEGHNGHSGEILETVDWLPDGKPNWTDAGICDERGIGTEAWAALVTALENAEKNAEIIGIDIVRVPRRWNQDDVMSPAALRDTIESGLQANDREARFALEKLLELVVDRGT